jgi:phage shock protein PspC (stress-responsive transcriptional regulator)
MSNPLYASSPPTSRFHRLGGPLGGVASVLGRTFGVSTALVRLGLVLATAVFGAVVVAIYVALWLVVPVDRAVPIDERPDRPPLSLLIVLAIIFGIGVFFDVALGLVSLFFSAVPVTLMALGLVLLFLIVRRGAGSR